ncbi:MAG: bifunctional diguanylate cyclase/phosphodiesterase [Epsilonproteobacteria bacterium]|nr:hypothetical protein [Campylobacterota bacterium]NPA56514.1 bifunctional diguanylate cyclase/phosphodiesterase [Campylobacterota bacterium]
MGQDLRKYLYFLIAILIFILFISILYYKFDRIISLTREEFIGIKIKDARHSAQVIEAMVEREVGQVEGPSQLEDSTIQWLNGFLSTFIDEEYRYVYLIYEDEKGYFRYLADGSLDSEDRGEFGQKFFPLEEATWRETFDRGTPHYFSQQKIDTLWITYLYPLPVLERYKTFLVMDISTKAYKSIDGILQNLKHYLEHLLIFFGGISLLTLGLYFLIYKENRRNFIDPLTQVYNRNFLKRIENSIPLDQVAVAMIDIDYFKNVNDAYGHHIGDRVLQEVARIIQKNIRKEDILIRYGGEEFLLIAQKGSREGIRKMLSRIHAMVENTPIQVDQDSINVTLSIGLNEIPEVDQNIFDAIKRADMKLYQAKHNGRNRIEILSQETGHDDILLSFEKITELIIEKQIEIHYQPIYNLRNPSIVIYEALARLRDGTKLIYPGSFLPIISRTNYYIDFTTALLQEVFDVIRRERVTLSINFKKSDFLDTKLSRIIESIVLEHRELTQYLIFEILEDEEVKMSDEHFFQRIRRLKQYGLRIAIDDFGSGYSNLHYFLHISPDIVKIDGGIIRQLKENSRAQEIVRSIAIFTENIGATTVAEFIEDEETLQLVKRLGVEYGQGYYLGKPSRELVKTQPYKVLQRVYANA